MHKLFFAGYIITVVLLNLSFLIILVRTLLKKRLESGWSVWQKVFTAVYNFLVQFLAAFGVSDFTIHIIMLRKLKLVEDKELPGTMLSSCVLPQAVMAIAYLSTVPVDYITFLASIFSSILGAIFGVKFISRLNETFIKRLMGCALLLSSILIVLGKLSIIPVGGILTGISGWKLIILGSIMFILSALNMGGFTTTALLLTLLYTMGISPLAAYPLAMGSVAISIPIGSTQFIKTGCVNLRQIVYSTIFGSLGAILAVFVVRQLNVNILQWIIALIAVYCGLTILLQRKNNSNPDHKSGYYSIKER